MIDFQIKQFSNLPILSVEIDRETSDIIMSQNFDSYILTFTLLDDKNCIVLKEFNKTKLILSLEPKGFDSSNSDTCEETYVKGISFEFTEFNTTKIGKYKGFFSLYINLDDDYKEIILTDKIDIEIIPSIHS